MRPKLKVSAPSLGANGDPLEKCSKYLPNKQKPFSGSVLVSGSQRITNMFFKNYFDSTFENDSVKSVNVLY